MGVQRYYPTMSKPKHCKYHVFGRLVAEIRRICRFADRASHPPCKKHCKFCVFRRNAAKRRFWDHTMGGGGSEPRTRIIYIYIAYILYHVIFFFCPFLPSQSGQWVGPLANFEGWFLIHPATSLPPPFFYKTPHSTFSMPRVGKHKTNINMR